jgi:hypothetical protein
MRWLLWHSEERGKEEVETSRARQADREIMAGCRNPNCLAVTDGSREVTFYRYGEDRRCTLCHMWRNNRGGEERSGEAVLKSLFRKGSKEGCKNEACKLNWGVPQCRWLRSSLVCSEERYFCFSVSALRFSRT